MCVSITYRAKLTRHRPRPSTVKWLSPLSISAPARALDSVLRLFEVLPTMCEQDGHGKQSCACRLASEFRRKDRDADNSCRTLAVRPDYTGSGGMGPQARVTRKKKRDWMRSSWDVSVGTYLSLERGKLPISVT
jgi:hypothetical protein